ncbi:MAG: hypothetical protein AMXMBFR47_27540 [Planctomycetota bacterium]
MIRTVPNAVSLFLSLILPAAAAQQAGPPLSPDAEIVLREYLVIEPCGRGGRNPVHTDAIEAAIVAGTFEAPREGLKVALPGGGEKEWKSAAANDKGELQHAALRGGYAFTTVTLAAAGTMLLDASGHSMVYVNGEPRAGDVYSNGSVILPVALREGENTFLFAGGRGRVAARLKPTDGKPFFTDRDWTLPDVIVGESEPLWVGVVIANPANAALSNATIVATTLGGKSLSSALPSVPALSTRECPIRFEAPGIIEGSEVPVKLELSVGGALVAETTIQIAPRLATEQHKRTFVSDIDGSVQYYAVTPPREPVESPALFLSVHGASVEATNQAAAYAPKNWGVVVAPTNRRPYGFDWEDWGRLDALEVLKLAEERCRTDPRRTYLTGHSMGGHGSWQLSVHYPDRFAAVGPSAGWISFFSYGGTDRTASEDRRVRMLQRAANSSDTLALIENLRTMGVYILHGDADDNVPVSEAREMRRRLGDFHRDYDWHEQPGAGHWWENSDEPGAECVDWPPMFDFFARHRRPAASEIRDVDFRTVAPSISDRCDWVRVVQQEQSYVVSRVKLRVDPHQRRFTGVTENVRRLQIDLAAAGLALEGDGTIELDGQKLTFAAVRLRPEAAIDLMKVDGTWQGADPVPPQEKTPARGGPFRDAFRQRFVFVYGTQGDADENAWAAAKARYDAESWWYRGNGSVDVVADSEFDAAAEPDRSVILYGNAVTNAAWKPLLGAGPVQVTRGHVQIGKRQLDGSELLCLLIRPRPGSDVASVGAIAGSGVEGSRLADRIPYFLAGVAFPDCTILSTRMLREGAAGVKAAGFFGPDWSVERGEWAVEGD